MTVKYQRGHCSTLPWQLAGDWRVLDSNPCPPSNLHPRLPQNAQKRLPVRKMCL